MLLRVFTLGFDPATGRFNDDPVRDFIADKEVATISDHFFVKDETPYLVLVVRYRLAGPVTAAPVSAPAGARQRDESWRSALAPADWPLFNTLRDWRGERARADGVPSYVICNNRQLVDVVKKRPATLAELGQIEGFGNAKLKKFGAEIIDFRNLLTAARRAARGKRDRPSVARFEFYLERELIALQAQLTAGVYRAGSFFTFEVRDPKRRAICAAPFRDRVVHHAVCDVLEPAFERRAIFDSYACRRGKGTHAAIVNARQACSPMWPTPIPTGCGAGCWRLA